MESLREVTNTYRLIVTRRNASEILVLPNGPGWTLPRVEIHPQQRIAQQLTEEITKTWGFEAYCLFVSTAREGGPNGEARCAVMESVTDDNLSEGTRWIRPSALSGCIPPREARAIQDALAEIDSYSKAERAGDFARPGWLQDLLRWTQKEIEPWSLRLTGAFRQLNAGPTFSLIRIETDAVPVWFKATGEPNSHELSLSVVLWQLFPPYVPQILGVHRAWNGWLSAEAPGTSLDQISDFSAWKSVAETLGKIQIASITKTGVLLEAQAKDLRIPNLAERIDPFIARMGELMAMQEKPIPAPLASSELVTLAHGLKESCAVLASCGLPNTLGHADFNPGNILVCGDRCVFLDWAEGCVTNPLLTFEYLREHMTRSGIREPAASERLMAAYLRPWASFYSPDDLRRALTLSPLVAVFAYALANDAWRSVDPIHNPMLAAYLRSLTRRMYREAIHVAQRTELCLA